MEKQSPEKGNGNGNKVRFTSTSIKRKAPNKGHKVIWDTVQSGLGLRINAGGRRTYFCMPRVNGVQEKVTLGTTDNLGLAEARDECREVYRNAEKGIGKMRRVELERQKRIEAERTMARRRRR